MNIYSFLLCYLPLFSIEQSHEEFYHEIARERDVTRFILNERLHVVDRNIDKLKVMLEKEDCPVFLHASQVRLLNDKDMIENMLASLRKY